MNIGPWEEIVLLPKNKFRKAVATGRIEHRGVRIKADIIKPQRGDAYWVNAGTGTLVRKATPAEVDAIGNHWRPYTL